MRASSSKWLASLAVLIVLMGGASFLSRNTDQTDFAVQCSLGSGQTEDTNLHLSSAAPKGDRGVTYGHWLTLDDLFEIGRNQYEVYCQICHGVEGRGDGPAGDVLHLRPSDLTQMAKNNGGEFPWSETFRIIDGRSKVEAHEQKGMPVWGERWTEERFTEDEPHGGEDAAYARIRCVAHYLSTIQEE
jgi:hypothetical protein